MKFCIYFFLLFTGHHVYKDIIHQMKLSASDFHSGPTVQFWNTEPQNTSSRRGTQESIYSQPCSGLQSAKLDQFAQSLVRSSVGSIEGWQLHNFSGWPVPMFDHPYGEKDFQISNLNLLCHSLCLLPHIILLCTAREEFGLIFSTNTH